MTLRVLIADDELMAQKRLVRLVEAIGETEVVGCCSTGREVLDTLASTPADVVLLDINMPELDGIQTSQLIDDTFVIFVTAHAEHALDAFDGGAIDYVLKPVQASRLKTALDRARARQRAPTSTRLPVQTRNGVVLIAHETITHVVIEGASVVLYTPDDRYFLDLRLSDVERALPDALLRRVHRNALVNLDHVQRFEAVDSGGYIAHIGPDAKIAVSRKAARELRRHWKLS